MKFVLATHNLSKIREMGAILGQFGVEVVSPKDLGITVDVEETGADTSMVTENRFSPVFSARTGSWQLAASLLRFWTAASLSTRISSVSGVCSSARAFFAITTGMGHCLPSASTTTDMEHNSFNSDFQVQCITIHRDSQEKTTGYGKTPAETSAGANSVRRSQGYAPFGRPPHL